MEFRRETVNSSTPSHDPPTLEKAMSEATKPHWDDVYGRRSLNDVSWYQAEPTKSLELIRSSGVGRDASIIDVGGGASFLVDRLLSEGYQDLTVLDISSEVLRKVRDRLGPSAERVTLVQADVTEFRPTRRYRLWHDRAVFHFLVDQRDRARYVAVLKQALEAGGHVIIATFGPEGPERCSGLPVQRYAAETLAQALGPDFTLVESFLDVHRTPSGAAQQFLFCHLRYEPRGV
jgi:SAM-dependent methyltransferase